MDKRFVLVFTAAIAIAVGAYLIGRNQAPIAPAPQGQQAAAPSAAGPGHPPAVPTDAPPPPRDFDHFRLGNRNVKAMVADDDAMWIGSSGGVIRYTISKDSHLIYDNKSGLLSNGVFHLSRFGNELWVGTYGGGLSILDTRSGTWRGYNVPDGMGDAFVYDVLHAANGDTWIATWSGANRVRGNKLDDISSWDTFTVENTKGGLPNDWVYGLAAGKNGEIWLATEGGVARFKDEKWTRWTHAEGLGAQFDLVKSQMPLDSDPGTTSRHHAQQKKEQGLENVSIAYNPNYVISISIDDKGGVWAGTWGAGLSYYDGTAWKTYTMADGLPSNHIFMLRRTEDGLLWVGTNRGLVKYDGKTFKLYTTKDGLFSDNVFSITYGKDGSTWVGSFGGIARYRRRL
ncbi:MAG: regulator [Alphaproteobacteria bacterium]